MRSVVPVDPYNPGQAFAALGMIEALSLLGHDAASHFDLMEGAFVVDAPGDVDPVGVVVEAVLGASHAVPARWQALVDAARAAKEAVKSRRGKPRVDPSDGETDEAEPDDGGEEGGGTAKTPEYPATLLLRGAVEPVLLDLWLPLDGREPIKLHAGNQTGVGILRDVVATLSRLDAVRDPVARARIVADPFGATQGVPPKGSGRYGLDTRTARASLPNGWSANALKVKPHTYPIVEALSLVGAQRARPPGSTGRGTLRYGLWTESLPPVLARQAFVLSVHDGPVVACLREDNGKACVITRGGTDRHRPAIRRA